MPAASGFAVFFFVPIPPKETSILRSGDHDALHVYTEMAAIPCDDFFVVSNLPLAPLLPCSTWTAANPHGTQSLCSQRTLHGNIPHTVCGNCYDRNVSQIAALVVYRDATELSPEGSPNGTPLPGAGGIATTPWPPPQAPPNTRFDGFWTRLCRTCERIEEDKFDIKIQAFQATGLVPVNGQFDAQWDFPWNQCTCIKKIGWPGPNLLPPNPPARHPNQPTLRATTGRARERHCIGFNPASTCCMNVVDQIILTRDANDIWLQSVSRSPDGVLCRASQRTRRLRNQAQSSSHRACRCGGDTSDTKPHDAEVLMCMACEGLWCLRRRGTPGSKYQSRRRPARRNATRAGVPMLNARGVGDMALRRPHAEYTDTGGP